MVDESNAWISCLALNRNAFSKAVVEGFEVVFFFGTGRGPVGASPGCLCAMEDLLSLPVAEMLVRKGRMAMDITEVLWVRVV